MGWTGTEWSLGLTEPTEPLTTVREALLGDGDSDGEDEDEETPMARVSGGVLTPTAVELAVFRG